MTTEHDLPTPVHTPVRRYANPDTGSRITYIAMLHAAQPAYYAAVNALLDDLETSGTTIHYERVREPDADELARASERERAGAAQLKASLQVSYERAVSVGLAPQRDHLALRESWQNHDISTIGVARFYGEEIQRQQREGEQREQYDSLTTPQVRSLILQSLAEIAKVATGEQDFESFVPDADRMLATVRETIALCALDKHLALAPGSDLALVWGVAHLPHFAEALVLRGYKEDGETTWLTAVDPAELLALEE